MSKSFANMGRAVVVLLLTSLVSMIPACSGDDSTFTHSSGGFTPPPNPDPEGPTPGGPPPSYSELINNPRIRLAIEANPFVTPGDYDATLNQKIAELESGSPPPWDDLRPVAPHEDEEIREIFLRKVALSLYVEVHDLVSWSLLDYTDEELSRILGDTYFNPDEYSLNQIILFRQFNNNPYRVLSWAQENIFSPQGVASPQDVLFLTVMKMREQIWIHAPQGYDYVAVCGYFDFQCLDQVKLGTSTFTPLFLYSILQALNIPARQLIFLAHGGIIFPSLDLGMDGDAVYARLPNGIHLVPNFIPVEHTFHHLDDYLTWDSMPPCLGSHEFSRANSLRYVALAEDPQWNADVLASYCFIFPEEGFAQPGDQLAHYLTDDQKPFFCQSEERAAEDYFAPPLTTRELAQWFTIIGDLAECS